MTNRLMVICLFLILSKHCLAVDAKWFIGGGIGYQSDTSQSTIFDQQIFKGSNDVAIYQIKGGAILNTSHRIALEYSYSMGKISDAGDEIEILGPNQFLYSQQLESNLYLITYDFLYPLSDTFNWFVGATLGTSNNRFTDGIDSLSKSTSTWGVQTGIDWNITNKLATSLTYRYLDRDSINDNFELSTMETELCSNQLIIGIAFFF